MRPVLGGGVADGLCGVRSLGPIGIGIVIGIVVELCLWRIGAHWGCGFPRKWRIGATLRSGLN
jgi:hypothetical protein